MTQFRAVSGLCFQSLFAVPCKRGPRPDPDSQNRARKEGEMTLDNAREAKTTAFGRNKYLICVQPQGGIYGATTAFCYNNSIRPAVVHLSKTHGRNAAHQAQRSAWRKKNPARARGGR